MYIAEWMWDDENIEHIAGHAVTPADVDSVLVGEPKFRKNRKDRAASHQMIGPDAGGRTLAIFIRESGWDKGLWRVITARKAVQPERDWWEKS